MKKFLIVLIFLFLSMSSVVLGIERAEMTERWQERRDGIVVEDVEKTTSILIPTQGATPAQVDRIATTTRKVAEKNIGKKIDDVNDAVAAAGNKTADAIAIVSKDTAGAIGDLKKHITNSEAGTRGILKNHFDTEKWYQWCILGLLLILIIIVLYNTFFQHKKNDLGVIKAVDEKLDSLDKKIDAVPAETAKAVKAFEPISIDFTVRGKNVSYTPPIVNGTYLSLYVPKSVKEEVDDPAKIIRLPIDHRGKMYKSTLEVIATYLDGGFNGDDIRLRQQKDVISFAQGSGQLKIA